MTTKKDKEFVAKGYKNGNGLDAIKLDSNSINNSNQSDTVKRTNKPLMEKRRRARINQSLAILKALILESNVKNNKAEGQKHSKLEKADILEITVRHFQRHRNLENMELDKYKAGYTDCVREVARFLATPEPAPSASTPSLSDAGSKTRLLRHLDNCISEINAEIKETKDPKISIELSKSPISQSCVLDSSSQDSSPIDFSKTGRKFQAIKSENKPTIIANLQQQMPQDENNNRDNESSESYPQVNVINIPKKRASNRAQTATNKRLKVSSGVAEKINKNVAVVEMISPGSDNSSCDRNNQTNTDSNASQPTTNDPSNKSVLMLPTHYMQLATALGLNPQAMLDQTATDFESLIESIELNRKRHSPESQSQFDLYKKTLGINDLAKTKIGSNVGSSKELKIPSPLSSIAAMSYKDNTERDKECSPSPTDTKPKEILPMLLAAKSPLHPPALPSTSPHEEDNPSKSQSPPILNIPMVSVNRETPTDFNNDKSKEPLSAQNSPSYTKASNSPDISKIEDENLENKQQNFLRNSDEDVWRPW